MSEQTQYAPCIHLHTSSERPCPSCLVHDLFHKHTNLRSEDPACSICFNDYNTPCSDTGAAESPVQLPCGHNFGHHCLERYFSPAPSGGNGSTCPACKHELFKAWPKPMLEESDRMRQLEELEAQRAISQQMLKASVRHHQMMARTARLPTVGQVLYSKEHRWDKKHRLGLWDRLFGQSPRAR